jgi:hypothetical protein
MQSELKTTANPKFTLTGQHTPHQPEADYQYGHHQASGANQPTKGQG